MKTAITENFSDAHQPSLKWNKFQQFSNIQILCKLEHSSHPQFKPQPVGFMQETTSGKRLYQIINHNLAPTDMTPGLHYLAEPPQNGYLLRDSLNGTLKLVTPLDFRIQKLYQSAIFKSYGRLGMSDIHVDIRQRKLPSNIPQDPKKPDVGLHAFSIIASTGTIDEWRGQEDDDRVPALESFYSIDNDKELDGFVLFGKKADSANDYYVAQMGTAETGKNLGTNLMTKVINEVKSRASAGETTKLFVATRYGNGPAIHLYENKLGFKKIDATNLGLPNDRFQGYELEINR